MTSSFPILGSNAERARSRNRQTALGCIRTRGAMGRAELARALALSTQAVSNIIADLTSDGLLNEKGARSAGRGLPAMQYAINPSGAYALGVEIRPSALFLALMDLSGARIGTRRVVLDQTDPNHVLGLLIEHKAILLTETGLSRANLTGVGIVMPGPFGETGLSGRSADLPGWQSLDIRAFFEDGLDLPVELSNDANAAALAERLGGAAQGLHTYAYLYFGEGIGLGVVQNGQLMRGAFGNAGEIGLIPMPSRKGFLPLEDCLSRRGVQISLGQPLSFDDLTQLFTEGNADLLNWQGAACEVLSHTIMLIENLFDPQTIFLGGAMPAPLLDAFIADVRLPDASVSHRPDPAAPRLMRGRSGRMTATIGAASLVLNKLFTPDAIPL